ncbi:hypothetical protein T07_5774 [Trichinella nelsoni]|uniref:Uncharacterized protein n=1 Tax=Trichinella nelsoni TaxID=6336 RepID=A0A0V0S031_9BILA|nr:hypothetical protein T07_5774 [Trichinella nelsoni]
MKYCYCYTQRIEELYKQNHWQKVVCWSRIESKVEYMERQGAGCPWHVVWKSYGTGARWLPYTIREFLEIVMSVEQRGKCATVTSCGYKTENKSDHLRMPKYRPRTLSPLLLLSQ